MNIIIKGKSGKYYFFKSFDINETINKSPCDIYVFARKVKVNNGKNNSFFQSIYTEINFDKLTPELIIEIKKQEGTLMLCLLSDENLVKEDVIEDLKEDGSYKIKIEES